MFVSEPIAREHFHTSPRSAILPVAHKLLHREIWIVSQGYVSIWVFVTCIFNAELQVKRPCGRVTVSPAAALKAP